MTTGCDDNGFSCSEEDQKGSQAFYFEAYIASYIFAYVKEGDEGNQIDVKVNMDAQKLLRTDSGVKLQVEFSMSYASRYFEVDEYPFLFQQFVREDPTFRDILATNMQLTGVPVEDSGIGGVSIIDRSTPSPTISKYPTSQPTTRSPSPSLIPTNIPTTSVPTNKLPTDTPTLQPSGYPSGYPSIVTMPPTNAPTSVPTTALSVSPTSTILSLDLITVIGASVGVAVVLIFVCLLCAHKKGFIGQRSSNSQHTGKEVDTDLGNYSQNSQLSPHGKRRNNRNNNHVRSRLEYEGEYFSDEEEGYSSESFSDEMAKHNNNGDAQMTFSQKHHISAHNLQQLTPDTREALISNPSLISPRNSHGNSDDDDDMFSQNSFQSHDNNYSGHMNTLDNNFDVLDEYKDQKLERMREHIEGNVRDTDGMMSQALMRALTDDAEYIISANPVVSTGMGGPMLGNGGNSLQQQHGSVMTGGGSSIGGGGYQAQTGPPNRDVNKLFWGGNGDSMEIEASVLCDTNDWLKRTKDQATLEDKRSFMQDTLNKMVASVRYNVIAPEMASRAIHGSAAMLELPLAADFPQTALIVTGMRKKVIKEDLCLAFREFGEIEGAAVAPNARGFGLVRYKTKKSVQNALRKFQTDEIVVQDVAINIKVLRATTAPPPHPQPDMNISSVITASKPPMPPTNNHNLDQSSQVQGSFQVQLNKANNVNNALMMNEHSYTNNFHPNNMQHMQNSFSSRQQYQRSGCGNSSDNGSGTSGGGSHAHNLNISSTNSRRGG